MSSRGRFLGAVAVTLLFTAATQAGPIRVGSVASSRFGTNWTLDGKGMANARAKLLNPVDFGSSGTVRRAISITDTAATVGSVNAALLANFDIFFIGYLWDGSSNAFTGAELDAFKAWVAQGGTMVVTCDASNYDAVCSTFGFPVAGGAYNPGEPVAAAVDHPFFNGPFGTVSQLEFNGSYSRFDEPVSGTVLVRDSAAAPGKPVLIIRRWGAGRVVVMGDVDIIADTLTAGAETGNDNDRFLCNLFAFPLRRTTG